MNLSNHRIPSSVDCLLQTHREQRRAFVPVSLSIAEQERDPEITDEIRELKMDKETLEQTVEELKGQRALDVVSFDDFKATTNKELHQLKEANARLKLQAQENQARLQLAHDVRNSKSNVVGIF